MEYKARLDEDMRHKLTHEDNTYKLYDLLCKRCSKDMQEKISSRPEYDSLVYNNLIALLQTTKDHSLQYQ